MAYMPTENGRQILDLMQPGKLYTVGDISLEVFGGRSARQHAKIEHRLLALMGQGLVRREPAPIGTPRVTWVYRRLR